MLTAMLAVSCGKADDEFTHDDATISAIYLTPASGSSSISIAGVIDNEAGTITFTIPKAQRKKVSISEVKLRANVAYDAFITPSLSGVKCLDEPIDITVTAKMTGRTQNYTISAVYGK